MRTVEEIAAYYEAYDDLLGFTGEVLLPYLPRPYIDPYLNEGVTDWTPTPLTRETILAEMAEYMTFAWDKAGDHRGISANRSVEKMQAWLWLLGDEATLAFAQDKGHYANYGAPVLQRVCEVYGWPIPTDPGLHNMMRGQPCRPDCDEGCGRSISGSNVGPIQVRAVGGAG